MSVTLSPLYLLFLQTTLANTVQTSSNELSLHWVTNTTMAIQFPDTSTSTISLYPPMETIEPDTPCLYNGRLETEEDSQVVVVGCKDSQEDTEVMIKSNKIRGGLVSLILRDGVTHILSLDDLVTGGNYTSNKREKRDTGVFSLDNDMMILPESEIQFDRIGFTGPLPKAVTLETDMYYDNTLLDLFKNNHKSVRQYLSKVLEFTKTLMIHPTLVMSVHLKTRKVKHLNERIRVTGPDIDRLAKRGYKSMASFFCVCPDNNVCDAGIAVLSSVCSNTGSGININNKYAEDSELKTAEIWAHELGHNLGMRHDVDHDGGDNNPCVGTGRMSGQPTGWSTCSNKDFVNYYIHSGYTCLLPYKGIFKTSVTCGGHEAPSCGECPSTGIKAAQYCHGECSWRNGKCVNNASVNCGGHTAPSCGECLPLGHGATWCHGECSWRNGKCVKKDPVNCGDHKAPSCGECPSTGIEAPIRDEAFWCHGECSWRNGKCVNKGN